ncbi:MAG: hypothetical protein GX348_06390 [Veillonellaceae bacterium]|jgi:hypothetical protein|nr:hypothetical protein [Veillonellaceae bacterium]
MKERGLSARTVVLPFLLHTAIVITAYFLADFLPKHYPAGFINPALPINPAGVIDKLIKWDAHWYTYIVDYGYDKQSIVFFPALVIFIKLLTLLNISTPLAGLIVCNIFSLLSFWAMGAVLRLDFSEKKTFLALLAYSIMPTSFFLNSIYTEPLFITFALTCVYFARQKKWWLSGIFAALATLTRNIGIVLVIFLYIELRNSNSRRSKLPLILPPFALLGFMLYNFLLTGDMLAFYHTQQLWGRQFGLPWSSFANNISIIFAGWPLVEPGTIIDSFIVTLALAALLFLTFSPNYKIRFSYLIVGWLWFLIPLFSTSPYFPLYSLARFVLVIFPLYIFLAQTSKTAFHSYFTAASLTLLICASLFMNWYWIG